MICLQIPISGAQDGKVISKILLIYMTTDTSQILLNILRVINNLCELRLAPKCQTALF
jgi:hypothetical protein